jgi:hypothetical protein
MYHRIGFTVEFVADLELDALDRLEPMLFEKDSEVLAEVRPLVVETEDGPVEVADLQFFEGGLTRLVPYSYFRFVD